MNRIRFSSRYFLVALLAFAVCVLCTQIYGLFTAPTFPVMAPQPKAEYANASLSLRNSDFPNTYIGEIDVDLESPNHWVKLAWSGPKGADQNAGPFHSSPGVGDGCDCNELAESNRNGSLCTPKGEFTVAGFNDFLPHVPSCKFATWIDVSREIAFHSHTEVSQYPSSHGCVRLDPDAAQLIHNNAIAGRTKVRIDGHWTRRPVPPNFEQLKK